MQGHDCPACLGGPLDALIDLGEVPVNSCIGLASRAEALAYPRGRLVLGRCPACGYVCNMAFDPTLVEYSARYEETQGYSATFREFHRTLAADLVARHRLRGRRVLEIGCGKGEFLALLAEAGAAHCQGFDPGYDPGRAPAGVEVIRAFYGAGQDHVEADFVCCKMTLEHIHRPRALLAAVARDLAGRPDAGLFFMVPDASRILAAGAFEDVYYEHCAYYTPASLAGLFRRNGFVVTATESLYGGQYLAIHGRPGHDDAATEAPDGLAAGFSGRYREKLAYWRDRVAAMLAGGERIALWGGGSKAVAFLGALPELGQSARVVDINPHRQGIHLPGSGHRVAAPVVLREYRPDRVIIMNALYRPEIEADLREMGVVARVDCL